MQRLSGPGSKTGEVNTKDKKGRDLDPTSAAYKTAAKACESLQPPGLESSPRRADAAMLKFAQCVRAHGVKNFPDPKDGVLGIKGVMASTRTRRSSRPHTGLARST